MDHNREHQHSDMKQGVQKPQSSKPNQKNGNDRQPAIRDLSRTLTKNYAGFIRRLAKKFGSVDFASDTLHDVYVKVEGEQIGKEIRTPSAYLYRMAVNIGLNRVRRDQRASVISPNLIENLSDPAPDPERIAAGIVELNAVLRELCKMPDQRRAIFLARWRDDRDIAAIASDFGLHRRTVQKELAKTEAHLRTALRRGAVD